MNYKEIKERLLKNGTLFRDDSFPANEQSLCVSHHREDITWKRPGMIVRSGKPKFVVKTTSQFDFDQGELGDCWFIAAAATLASSHWYHFTKVVPMDQSFNENYAGIFHFRFWSYGTWKEVIIDDYLPCTDTGLLYCRNREEPNEFWAALLEKAYAKFHGSYENLRGGYIHYALSNLTGGITEVIPIKPGFRNPDKLYDLLVRSHTMNAFIGGGIFKPVHSKPGEIERSNGLFMGHAYSVTGFQTLQFGRKSVRLLRVRNPWGRGEWKGKWSDRWLMRAELSDEHRLLLGQNLRKDGEFWISIEDFVKNFNQIQMCHLEPDSMTSEVETNMKKDKWSLVSYHGEWGEVVSTDTDTDNSCCCSSSSSREASQFNNPQYYIRLRTPDDQNLCTLVVSLMEKESRKDPYPEVYINFFIYKLRGDTPERITRETRRHVKLVGRGSKNFVFYKEVSGRVTLNPGCYVVVPETYREDAQAKFLLRFFSKKEAESGLLTPPSAS